MMIDDATRNNIADQLKHDAVYRDDSSLSEWWARLQSVACECEDFPDPRSLFMRLAGLIRPSPINGSASDGYHTFDELYHHRAVLFSVVVSAFPDKAWKAKAHSDGTMYGGMFIVGIDTPDGQATYHYDIEPYWDMFRCKELDRAPEWDGHTPGQAIERIGKLADLIAPDTEGTEDVSTVYGTFKCKLCGCVIKDTSVIDNGAINYCPDCGKWVNE